MKKKDQEKVVKAANEAALRADCREMIFYGFSFSYGGLSHVKGHR